MDITKVTPEVREEVRRAMAEAAYHRAAMWDAMGQIERLISMEVRSDNPQIDLLASECDMPPTFPKVDDEQLNEFLENLKDEM